MPTKFQDKRLFIVTLAGTALLAACTQQPGSNSSGMPGSAGTSGGTQSGMQGMNMEQMMQHCREMQGMDRTQMTPDMQRMMQQCDEMMEQHGG